MGWLSLLMCALCLCCLSVQESLDIYTLSLHDALPISCWSWDPPNSFVGLWTFVAGQGTREHGLSRTQKGGSKISRYRKDWAADETAAPHDTAAGTPGTLASMRANANGTSEGA